ncbi:MAG: hypothetical protein OXK73_14025 [Rhodospirillaceae bacterium]|nr:hypothetical protein [Rhodospirillaceae bacterium]
MEFPLILIPAVRDGDPEPFESLIEQIEVAEELGYDVPMDEVEQRFSEALDILRRAWTEERFAYDNLGMFGTPDAVAEKVRVKPQRDPSTETQVRASP